MEYWVTYRDVEYFENPNGYLDVIWPSGLKAKVYLTAIELEEQIDELSRVVR